MIAIDIDPDKIWMAKRNAQIYGVADKIEFHVGNFFSMPHDKFNVDAIFMSPPWGGPSYLNEESFSLKSMCMKNGGGTRILKLAKLITSNIAIHLPKTTNIREVSSDRLDMVQHMNKSIVQNSEWNVKYNNMINTFLTSSKSNTNIIAIIKTSSPSNFTFFFFSW